jgi:hypothetical protein
MQARLIEESKLYITGIENNDIKWSDDWDCYIFEFTNTTSFCVIDEECGSEYETNLQNLGYDHTINTVYFYYTDTTDVYYSNYTCVVRDDFSGIRINLPDYSFNFSCDRVA